MVGNVEKRCKFIGKYNNSGRKSDVGSLFKYDKKVIFRS